MNVVLGANDYDGLVNLGLCSCGKDEIGLCCEDISGCEPAYAVKVPCEDCEIYCKGYDPNNINTICYLRNKMGRIKN